MLVKVPLVGRHCHASPKPSIAKLRATIVVPLQGQHVLVRAETNARSLLFSQLLHFFTRLWTTNVWEPELLLNSVGRFFPSSSKQTFSVSPSIS